MNTILIAFQIAGVLGNINLGLSAPDLDTTKMNDAQFNTYIMIREKRERALMQTGAILMNWSAQMQQATPPPVIQPMSRTINSYDLGEF